MRIIAGSARSLPLMAPEGLNTRPTTDKIKETLFNILQGDIAGSRFLDLFAGSGQIGLEAVSRGADCAVFVENNKKAAKCIAENIRFTKFDAKCRLMQTDALAALRSLEGTMKFDLVFMDPPYDQGMEEQALSYLSGSRLLEKGATVIVEASARTDFSYAEELGFTLVRLKKYKSSVHAFFRKNEEET